MKNKKVTIEDLVAMVQTGFAEADKKNGERFDVLETGQEEIKLKLGNVAYRFELVEL